MLTFLKRRWWLLLVLPLLLVLGFVGWALLGPQPMPEALAALESDPQVTVQQSDWIVFQPATTPTTGLILYPGGRVDERAYAPAAHALAAQGYLVVLVPMPLNFAVFAPDRATEVIAAFPSVQHWAIGGHSLGGAMATQFAHDHPDLIDGLALWAAYPPNGASLAEQPLMVASIFGTRDGVATTEDIDVSRGLLPPATTWVAIDGGNHAQFGWYGSQRGDLQAIISREAQQAQIITATLALLRQIERGGPYIHC